MAAIPIVILVLLALSLGSASIGIAKEYESFASTERLPRPPRFSASVTSPASTLRAARGVRWTT